MGKKKEKKQIADKISTPTKEEKPEKTPTNKVKNHPDEVEMKPVIEEKDIESSKTPIVYQGAP